MTKISRRNAGTMPRDRRYLILNAMVKHRTPWSLSERLVFQSALSEALVIAASSVRQGEAHTRRCLSRHACMLNQYQRSAADLFASAGLTFGYEGRR